MPYQTELQMRIQRIRQMEHYYDILLSDPGAIGQDETRSAMLEALKRYYEGGAWLQDYESDERGELPADLKRGVLSQDGLYDILGLVCTLDT